MKKLLAGALTITLVIMLSAFAFASSGDKTAIPSQAKFVLDGKEVSLDSAYLIDESNYLQLRSVAKLLSGTESQFNVYWDDKLLQAVIETGKPYTGIAPAEETPLPDVPQAYKIGDTISLENATLCLTKVKMSESTPPDEYGSTFVASSGHVFLCISFEVTANSLNYNNTLWHSNQFIEYATAASGVNYEHPFAQGTAGFGANEKQSATVYISVPDNETITSIVVSDGVSNSATVSIKK